LKAAAKEGVYAHEELESNAYHWAFQTCISMPPSEGRNSVSQVEVALKR
jgi:hypothetical protein